MKTAEEQMRIIMKGVSEVISEKDLLDKLEKSIRGCRPLVVKLGMDPSAPDIHLGHTVVLKKIKQLQDLGHKAVIIIGDFTGMIGDPTGRSKTRKQLSPEEVLENAATYERQIFKILDREKTELRFNSEWLSGLKFADVVNLAGKVTVARILERDDFEKRYKANESIGLHEFFYPLMQAYDSVSVKADIEIGGTDQRFNILMGRNLQKDYNQESQIALFMPLLEGTDGVEKMGKSLGNYIGIDEEAEVIYRKGMTIPDSLIVKYFELATDLHPDEVEAIKCRLGGGANPRDVKMELAKEITRLYHGECEAQRAEEDFKRVYQKNELPEEIPEFSLDDDCRDDSGNVDLARILAASGLAPSRSEARRLISQLAVKINGAKITGCILESLPDNPIVQVGKAKFLRIKGGGCANG